MSILEGRMAVLKDGIDNHPAGEEVKIVCVSGQQLMAEGAAGNLFLCGPRYLKLKPETEKPEWRWKHFDVAEMPQEDTAVLLLLKNGAIVDDELIDGAPYYTEWEKVEFYIPISEIPRPKI